MGLFPFRCTSPLSRHHRATHLERLMLFESASECKILTALKENKKYFGCKGKGRNFGCRGRIRQT